MLVDYTVTYSLTNEWGSMLHRTQITGGNGKQMCTYIKHYRMCIHLKRSDRLSLFCLCYRLAQTVLLQSKCPKNETLCEISCDISTAWIASFLWLQSLDFFCWTFKITFKETWAKPGAALQTKLWLIQQVGHPLPQMPLQGRQAPMVRYT